MDKKVIRIALTTGVTAFWDKGEWDEYYFYEGKMFGIKKNNKWIAFYNINNIISIVVE